MAIRYSASQIRSKLRQIESKRRQAINQYNNAVRRHNQRVRSAISSYNQAVRAHNARVRANRQRLKSGISRLSHQTSTRRYNIFRTSVESLHNTYTRFEEHYALQDREPAYGRVADLAERETANSVAVMNSLLGDDVETDQATDDLEQAGLDTELRKISAELHDRWQGAVFALNPHNPDAARHFCTSVREIFTQILNLKAPDREVVELIPDCERTPHGSPSRRSKIRFLLHRKGILKDELEAFVEEDMENILQLFRVFNDGTHGSAGAFDLSQLATIRKRVEDGISFLAHIVN